MAQYTLRTFGGLRVTSPEGTTVTGPGAQRRRLALLALLASAGDRGQTRDTLVGYLWGDSTEDNARHSLEEALHKLRTTFGKDLVTRAGASLCLNPSIMRSDVATFQDAVQRGDADAAVSVYTGPFLSGIHDDAPEFEQWTAA